MGVRSAQEGEGSSPRRCVGGGVSPYEVKGCQ